MILVKLSEFGLWWQYYVKETNIATREAELDLVEKQREIAHMKENAMKLKIARK